MTQQFTVVGERESGTRRTSFRSKPDGDADPAGEAGWYLQYERERRGETLADAALDTHIRATYLHALELGAMDQLPGWPYVIGIVRCYAKFLGLDPEPLVAHYTAFVPRPTVRERFGFEKNWNGRGIADLAGVSIAFCLGIALFAVWSTAPQEELVAQVPVIDSPVNPQDDRLVVEIAEPPSSPQITGSINTTPPVAPKGTSTDPSVLLDAALPTVRVKRQAMSDTPVPRPKPQRTVSQSDLETVLALDGAGDDNPGSTMTDFIETALKKTPQVEADKPASGAESSEAAAKKPAATPGLSTESPPSRITLRARNNVWLRVEDGGGTVLLQKTLASGEIFKVPDRKNLVLIVRDAGGLEASVDGQPFGKLGEPGGILPSQPLTPEAIRKLVG